ncbi:hypothetical protein MBLNU230_g5892t1 [Neophaeotheca triangularis]
MTVTTYTTFDQAFAMAPQPRDPGTGRRPPQRPRPGGPPPRDTGMHRCSRANSSLAMNLSFQSRSFLEASPELDHDMVTLGGKPQPRDPGTGKVRGRMVEPPQPRDPGN